MKSAHRAFTLIELLVVISIIGILSTLLVSNLNAARERGRDAQRKSNLREIENALRLYYNDVGTYPLNDAQYRITGTSWGNPWVVSGTTYISPLPLDPRGDSWANYRYERADFDSFTLRACLENLSDAAGDNTGKPVGWCPGGLMYQITVQ